MKVHITATSEVDFNLINTVFIALSEIKGPIQFSKIKPLLNSSIENVIGRFEDIQPLEFDVFFKICNHYRARRSLNVNDYVVVFTSLRNERYWFSSYDDNRNIFIDINDWGELSTTPLSNALAYQVIGNIFHSLVGIDPTNFKTDPIAHDKSIGCISDFCDDKSDILLKFRTAYICDNCLNAFNNIDADKGIIKQIYKIIQRLRTSFVNFQFDETIHNALPLRIDENLSLFIGDKEIDLEVLPKTLYFFFLMNQKGVSASQLRKPDNERTIQRIYDILKEKYPKSRRKTSPILKLCGKDINNNIVNSSFYDTKSRCNSMIVKNIDSSIQHFYIINNINDKNKKNSTFNINLSKEYLTIIELERLMR